MKKSLVTAALVLLLAMSGCAAADDSGDTGRVAAGSGAEEPAAPEPLQAEEAPATSAEQVFLDTVVGIPEVANADLDALLANGKETCDQLTAGVSPYEILPIEGAERQVNEDFVTVAAVYLCEENSQATQDQFNARHQAEG